MCHLLIGHRGKSFSVMFHLTNSTSTLWQSSLQQAPTFPLPPHFHQKAVPSVHHEHIRWVSSQIIWIICTDNLTWTWPNRDCSLCNFEHWPALTSTLYVHNSCVSPPTHGHSLALPPLGVFMAAHHVEWSTHNQSSWLTVHPLGGSCWPVLSYRCFHSLQKFPASLRELINIIWLVLHGTVKPMVIINQQDDGCITTFCVLSPT